MNEILRNYYSAAQKCWRGLADALESRKAPKAHSDAERCAWGHSPESAHRSPGCSVDSPVPKAPAEGPDAWLTQHGRRKAEPESAPKSRRGPRRPGSHIRRLRIRYASADSHTLSYVEAGTTPRFYSPYEEAPFQLLVASNRQRRWFSGSSATVSTIAIIR